MGGHQPVAAAIDMDVWLGMPGGNGVVPASQSTAEELVARLAAHGVGRAVAYHVVAREHAPSIGNALLLDEIADRPEIIPAFVVLPPFTEELPPPAELVGQLHAQGVRLARIFPASSLDGHRFALREWCVGPLLSALADGGVTLAVDFSLFRRGEPPWDDIVTIATAHPDLRIALPDVQGRNNRNLYALLDGFPNLFVGTGGLNVHTGVEDICARFGAHRLFFSSGWPVRSLGAARFVVDRAGIDAAERAQIFSGTATQLLNLTGTESAVPS